MCSWSGKRKKSFGRGGEEKKRKKGRKGEEERKGGRDTGRKKRKKRKKKKKGRIYTSTPSQRSPTTWHLKLPTLRGPSDLAGQACWWDPTLGPGHPLLLDKTGYTTPLCGSSPGGQSHGVASQEGWGGRLPADPGCRHRCLPCPHQLGLGASSSAHWLSQTDPRVFPDVRCG